MAVGISDIIDYDNLNIPGLWSLVRLECMTCEMIKMRDDGKRCIGCPFVFNSTYNNESHDISKRRVRVGCGVNFRDFGIKQWTHLGKHQLYFFLQHPELEFRLPGIPLFDMFGAPKQSTWAWHIHHLNHKYYDDRKENLFLCLNTEHNFIDKSGIVIWRWNY